MTDSVFTYLLLFIMFYSCSGSCFIMFGNEIARAEVCPGPACRVSVGLACGVSSTPGGIYLEQKKRCIIDERSNSHG